jgi:hypothetical protein
MTSLIRSSSISSVWGNRPARPPVVSSIYRPLLTSTIMEETLLFCLDALAAHKSRQKVCQRPSLFRLIHRMTLLRLSTPQEYEMDLCQYKYLVYQRTDQIRREAALKEMSGNL